MQGSVFYAFLPTVLDLDFFGFLRAVDSYIEPNQHLNMDDTGAMMRAYGKLIIARMSSEELRLTKAWLEHTSQLFGGGIPLGTACSGET